MSLTESFVARFWRLNQNHVLFHIFFSSALFIQVICFSLFFAKLAQSTMIAFCLAGIFLTIFSYLVLMFYLQSRKPEKLLALRDEFLVASRQSPEAIQHFMSQLSVKKSENPLLKQATTVAELVDKFRIWTQWKDLLKMKEMLLMASIREQIEQVKAEPSDLEAHALLANSYLSLSMLYEEPQLQWTPPEYQSEKMRHKFEAALLRALEEYQIIDAYAPNDPWVHAQRAKIYHALKQPEKEIGEYEKILQLSPDNQDVLLRLGALYFRQGQNARGLKIYDQLKALEAQMAEQLIAHYDAYSIEEYSF